MLFAGSFQHVLSYDEYVNANCIKFVVGNNRYSDSQTDPEVSATPIIIVLLPVTCLQIDTPIIM